MSTIIYGKKDYMIIIRLEQFFSLTVCLYFS